MDQRIYRSINTPIRKNLSWEEIWRREDRGLIIGWELGRKLQETDPELTTKFRNGELPIMAWKGGADKNIKAVKYGTLNYLATRQGILNKDLDLDFTKNYYLVCSKYNTKIKYYWKSKSKNR